ncbi:MAG: malectin domain-containing carbohydrate-binding protein [Planctomycetota bacterium]
MASAQQETPVNIVYSSQASGVERLAAKEIRRYLYLRTGKLLPIVRYSRNLDFKKGLIVIGRKDRDIIKRIQDKYTGLASSITALKPQQYQIKTLKSGNKPVVLICGGDEFGTLYGAYRFVEHFGVRFYLHGDIVPDKKIGLKMPDLDEQGKPLFELRGIHPFHDFPEGPDWWSVDDYKAVLAQLPKLRMNFFGLHCYPEGGVGPEPAVWIGKPGDVYPDGRVKFSSQSRHFTTHNGTWGYKSKDTADYSFGSDLLFERNDYGPDYMKGMSPWPKTAQDRNEVFNRFGKVLNETFGFARELGIKTCIGTETPLTIPKMVKEHLKEEGKNPDEPAVVQHIYEGMFQRIKKTHPLDYYWFWTPEGWTWGGAKDEQVAATEQDMLLAVKAARKVGAPFTLATCGWVLGPPKNRAQFDNVLPKEMPFSCINRQVGFAPVEPSFARLQGRPKWAIPWMEDDPAMIIPQLWAGRMRRDAADALAYGCTGLMGIHWRTRVLGPNVSALARAGWEQGGWNPDFGKKYEPPDPKLTEGREGGNVAAFPNSPMADTEDDTLYQTVRWDVRAYRFKVPNGKYKVRLQFCEPHYSETGKRVFGVELQGKRVIDKLDIFARVGKNKALDYTFGDVKVTNSLLDISFVKTVEFPCIAAIVIEGQSCIRKINCGGPEYKDYEADMPSSKSDGRPRDLSADDFYADWALTHFGPEAAKPIAKLFARLDGGLSAVTQGQGNTNLPRPSTWVGGPGGIRPDTRPWEKVSKEYEFVEELARFRPQVKGPGNLERFDYWLNTFRYLRALGRVNCTWAKFNAAMKKVKNEKQADTKKQLAFQTALPIRKELVAQVADVHRYLLATITTTGGMGNVTNWQQHVMPSLLTQPGKELEKILGQELPEEAWPSKPYEGPPRIIVPTVRGSLNTGEDLRLKVIVLAQKQPEDAFLYWRPMGTNNYTMVALTHIVRGVYSVTIPAREIKKSDLEYHIKVTTGDGRSVYFPTTAPQIDQTVVVDQ